MDTLSEHNPVHDERARRTCREESADQGKVSGEVRPARETRATRPLAPWPEWLDLHSVTGYVAVSERTVRNWIQAPVNPLPAVRIGGKILVKRAGLDRWLEQHAVR